MKKLTYLLVGSVFLGTSFLALDLGIAQLSLYRMIIAITIVYVAYKTLTLYRINKVTFNLNEHYYKLVYIVWLIYAFISVLWVVDIGGWINAMFFLGTGIFSILVISTVINSKERLYDIFFVFFFMGIFQQVLGWYEIFTGNYIGSNSGGSFLTNKAITTFANPNDYATLMFAVLTVSLVIFIISKQLKYKILSIVSAVSTLLLILKADSRANVLALFIFILTFAVVTLFKEKHLRIGIYTVGTLSTISLAIYLLFPTIRFTIYNGLNNFFSHLGSNVYRVNMIRNGFVFLAESYGLGVGAGNIEYWMMNAPRYVVDAPNMHNFFMEILTAYGIVVFILYTLMYIAIIRKLYFSYRYDNNERLQHISLTLLCFVVAYIIASISSATNIIIEWQWIFWGIIIAYIQLLEKPKTEWFEQKGHIK